MGVEVVLRWPGTVEVTSRRARKVDREHEYPPAEAIRLVKELKRAKFDESVEVHVRTGLNVRHADEQLRGTIALPNGLGKEVTIAVFAKGDKAREAEEAGADVVGAEDLAKRIEERLHRLRRRDRDARHDARRRPPRPHPRPAGQDAQPEGRHGDDGRRQGRRGVQGRQGRVPHRPHRDRAPHHRQDLFEDRALLENYAAVIEELVRAKPAVAKGRYIRSITMASTMGPGVKVDPQPHP